VLAFDRSIGDAHQPQTPVTTRCFEEQIAGRTYVIEVRAVDASRWRAQLASRPGMPVSLMPFYGPTPERAAEELSRWLTLVYNGVTKQ
jgi:hypothetical protein